MQKKAEKMIKLKIRQTALGTGRTLGQTAKEIGMDPPNFSNLVVGKRKTINLDILDKLCTLLECKVSDLIEYVPTEKGE